MSGRRPSIRLQILGAVTLITVVVIGGLGAVVLTRLEARAQKLAYQAALEDAHLLVLIAERGLDRPAMSFTAAVRTLRATGALLRFARGETGTRMQLFDTAGKVAFDSDAAEEKEPQPVTARAPASAGGADDRGHDDRRHDDRGHDDHGHDDRGHDDRGHDDRGHDDRRDVESALSGQPLTEPFVLADGSVTATLPIHDGSAVVGAVCVTKPSLGARAVLAELLPEIAVAAAGFFTLALVLAFAAGRALSRPIVALTQAARRIAAGDRAAILPPPAGPEVTELTTAFAEMRRELEDKNRVERLAQDLAHELKNPIASVRSLAEALGAGALEDAAAGPRLVARLQESAQRLDAIVNDLLTLARLEARGIERRPDLDLTKLAADAKADVEAAHPGAVVTLALHDLPRVSGDAVWLRRALVNLLTNGVQTGGSVTLSATTVDSVLRLHAQNPGEVPQALHATLFERFVSGRPQGTGLGLAIVRSVAEAHGGGAFLEAGGPPEVVLCMSLPL